MSLTAIANKEADNLTKLERLENQALSFTANKLSATITQLFESQQQDDINHILTPLDPFTQTYTASMMVSWLTGQYHVIKMVEDKTELSQAVIYLSAENVPFQEAIDALEATIPVDSHEYRQMEASMKLRAFTVANVSSIDAINRVKKLYKDALQEGLSRSEVMQNMDAYLDTAGVSERSPYWLELHYRNNMMTSYNTGRWTQVESNDVVQYLTYVSVLDNGTTKLCQELDTVTKPKTDSFWKKFYPPNHHKCRATVSALSQVQYDKLSGAVLAKSKQMDSKAINQDPTMKKEHQFKSSPMESMKLLPESLMKRAQEYELERHILEQSVKASSTPLTEQMRLIGKKGIPTRNLDKAIKESPVLSPFKEKITNQLLTKPDELFLGFEEVDDGSMPVINYLLNLDTENWVQASYAAYGANKVRSIQAMTQAQVHDAPKAHLTLPPEKKRKVITHTDIQGSQSVTHEDTTLSDTLASITSQLKDGKARPQGVTWHLAEIPQEVRAVLAARALSIQSNVVSVNDAALLHMLRDNKANRKSAGETVDKRLPIEFLEHLPKHLGEPDAIYLELNQAQPTLLYLFKQKDEYYKLSIKVDTVIKVKREEVMAGAIASGERYFDPQVLSFESEYVLIWENK